MSISALAPHSPGRATLLPLWWRVGVWTALTAFTVVQAPHHLAPRLAAGLLMGTGALVLQLVTVDSSRVTGAAALYTTAAGLGACYASHDGLAEILVAIAAGSLPAAFSGRTLHLLTALDAIAFGVTVAYLSRSFGGLLAGTAIPFVVQRAVEHRELVRERDRAQALLVEVQNGREAEAQAAALRERGRIARDMHDVLAHSLAGLSVQLQAVRAVAAREKVPAAVLDPIDKAATLARDGLAEARGVVGALRDPVGLGLDALPTLIDRQPGAATLTVTGEPATVSAEAGHAIYRAVQESLTNAARYAPGAPVTVTLLWRPGGLEVVVEDAGPAPGRTAVAGQGTGLGLAGMTERISAAGGTLQTGPHPGGGWRVALTVPTRAVRR